MADNQKKEKLSGKIENVVYRNESNDYTVLEISDENQLLVTAVGIMPLAFEGEEVVLNGHWTYHKEFGKQFNFDSFEKNLPKEVDGILQYLSSRTIKGVGPVTAVKIVNKYGLDTFDVIDFLLYCYCRDRLYQITGCVELECGYRIFLVTRAEYDFATWMKLH